MIAPRVGRTFDRCTETDKCLGERSGGRSGGLTRYDVMRIHVENVLRFVASDFGQRGSGKILFWPAYFLSRCVCKITPSGQSSRGGRNENPGEIFTADGIYFLAKSYAAILVS